MLALRADDLGGRPSTDSVDPAQFVRMVWLWTWLGTVDHSLRTTADQTLATVRTLPRHWWR